MDVGDIDVRSWSATWRSSGPSRCARASCLPWLPVEYC